MAVAEMSKLNLAAMSYDRDAVLNALQRTGAVEIKLHSQIENTVVKDADCESLSAYFSAVESALERLCAGVGAYEKENKIKSDLLKDGFDVSYTQFISASGQRAENDKLVSEINVIFDEGKELALKLANVIRQTAAAEIYKNITQPLGCEDTAHVGFKVGTLPQTADFSAFGNELFGIEKLSEGNGQCAVFAAYHLSVAQEAENALSEAGFTPCPFGRDVTGEQLYQKLLSERQMLTEEIDENSKRMYALRENIRGLKIYCDYLAFELEKAKLAEKMRATQTTFLLEAYVPDEAKERVAQAVDGAVGAVYYEFSKPSDDEVPPTLLKNNKVVKNFEAVTNMYSPVGYREFDPNTVMAFFYAVFLGFIMGDIGYGLLMTVLGGFVYFRIKRDTGMKRLAGVFAVGGIFAVIWGLLFNSIFGITMTFMPTVMPDAKDDMWLLMGIKIPAVLIISLLIGIVQLCAGYVCRAVQCWRRKQIWDGILDGMVWAVFTLGVGLALIGLTEGLSVTLAYAGGITAGVMLVIAMLTAGRKEKLLGKFTKGFGAAYGVINFASDVLSYARLYGLMLSGAVIAQIVSQYSVDFFFSGNALLIILGVVLMLVGHAFNLAIGLLGAYIHDSRLQYVEFYGRFFEGEGELFAPLGAKHKYIYLNN